MIKIEFTIDLKRSVYEQLVEAVEAFAPPKYKYDPTTQTATRVVPASVQQEAAAVVAAIEEHFLGATEENDATRVTPSTPVETQPTEPKKRGRKAKAETLAKEAEVEVNLPDANEQDAADEAAEAASDTLTHEDIRDLVGRYTKKFGIVQAQKNIPQILGGAIADIPNDQVALQVAIFKLQEAMGDAPATMAGAAKDIPLFAAEPETEEQIITESDVRDAMMAYARKYDVDDKMVNTLVDGPDILKKTFGPAVSALRHLPKDPESLRKAHAAIHDAIQNNWYNRKVVA